MNNISNHQNQTLLQGGSSSSWMGPSLEFWIAVPIGGFLFVVAIISLTIYWRRQKTADDNEYVGLIQDGARSSDLRGVCRYCDGKLGVHESRYCPIAKKLAEVKDELVQEQLSGSTYRSPGRVDQDQSPPVVRTSAPPRSNVREPMAPPLMMSRSALSPTESKSTEKETASTKREISPPEPKRLPLIASRNLPLEVPTTKPPLQMKGAVPIRPSSAVDKAPLQMKNAKVAAFGYGK